MKNNAKPRDGTTLIEVLLAVVILGVCLAGLLTGLSSSAEIFRASAFIHDAESAFNAGESLHPFVIENDPVSDLEVSSDEVVKGWTYERTVTESENEDDLYTVVTTVKKERGGEGMEQIYTRLVYFKH